MANRKQESRQRARGKERSRTRGREGGREGGRTHHAVGPDHDSVSEGDPPQNLAARAQHTPGADGRMTLCARRHLLAGRAQSD